MSVRCALDIGNDPGFFERRGAELEQEVGRIAMQYARRLIAVGRNLLGEGRVGDAQRRLSKLVFGIRNTICPTFLSVLGLPTVRAAEQSCEEKFR